MYDLISRQAAILELRNWWDDIEDNRSTRQVMESLPAIDPVKWIPCGERMPEDGKWAIFTDGKNISVERYKKDIGQDHFFPSGRWFDLDDVVAWMPLPEPYKGEA